MAGRSELLALAERVEALEGPDRGVFWEARMALFGMPDTTFENGCFVDLLDAEAWTDAVLTLMPEGFDWIIGHTNGGLTIYAEVGGTGGEYTRFAATPALSLLAAILRTKAGGL